MKKLLVSLGLACMALSLESAALRQSVRIGLVARAGVLRTMQPVQRALPHVSLATFQSIQSIATLSQSNKSYSKNKTRLLDFAALVPLGVVAAAARSTINEEQDSESIRAEIFIGDKASKLSTEDSSFQLLVDTLTQPAENREIKSRPIFTPCGLVDVASDEQFVESDENVRAVFDEKKAAQAEVYLEDLFINNRDVNPCFDQGHSSIKDYIEKVWSPLHFLSLERKNFWIEKFLNTYFSHSEENEDLLLRVRYLPLIRELSSDQKKIWFDRLYSSLTQHVPTDGVGPFFTSYFENNFDQLFIAPNEHNLNELLPEIVQYVSDHYKAQRIVFFHGQQSSWKVIEDVCTAIDGIKTGIASSKKFIRLRVDGDVSALSDEEVVGLRRNPEKLCRNDSRILFTNMNLFAGEPEENTWSYIANNFDQIVNKESSSGECAQACMRAVIHLLNLLTKKEFEDLERRSKLEELELCFPVDIQELVQGFENVCKLYEDAVLDQGNYGRLIIISMPRETARRLSYSAKPFGSINPIIIDGVETIDTATIAEKYDQAPKDNQFCIYLSKEMLNQEEAEKAAIEMQSFDPAIYWQTEKAQKYQAALKELMVRVKEVYEVRKAQQSKQ